MVANSRNSMSEAFANDAVNNVVSAGGNMEAALGNDVAATFNLGSGLSSWVSKINTGARNHVVVMGDSNVVSVSAEQYRWPVQLKTDLLSFTGRPDGGPGFRHLGLTNPGEWTYPAVVTVNPGQLNFETLGITPGFFPTESQFTGGSSDLGPQGYAYVLVQQNNIFTWTLASAPAGFTHDRFELYGIDDDFLGQQSEYSIDGGAFVSTAYSFAGTTGPKLVKQAVVTPITTTLRYRGSATGFPAYLVGAAFYQGSGAAGPLVVHNLGMGGNKVDQMVGRGSSNRLALIDDLQPILTVVWTGTNEFSNIPPGLNQMSLSTFDTKYRAIVTKARQYGDVLMVYPHATNVPNVFSLAPIPRQQADFERVARKIAYDLDAGYMSIHQLWGTWARANTRAFMADNHHINQAGHNAVSKVLTRAIRRVS